MTLPRPPNPQHIWWPALALLCLAPMLLVLPPVPIDETRYLSVAWEMRLSGAWLTPHLNGMPYFDKPPLLFWLINLMWHVTGISLWSARLLALMCGALCAVVCAGIERLLSGGRATVCAWLLVGSLFFALFSGVVMFDVLLCLFVLLAFYAVVRHVMEGTSPWWLLLAAACLGMFTKGPVVLVHLAGPLLLARWWAPPERTPRWRTIGLWLLCSVAGGLPVLLWAWLALHGLSQADAHDLLIRQTTGRVVESFAHNRPVWWYLPFLPALLLPWLLTWRWRGMFEPWSGTFRTSLGRFGVAASLPALLAFSIISGKQVHYLLPLLPGVFFVVAGGIRARDDLFPVRRWYVWVVVMAALTFWTWKRAGSVEGSTAMLALSVSLLLAATVAITWAGQRRSVAMSACVSLILVAALLPLLRLQVFAPMNPVALANKVRELQQLGTPVVRTPNEPGMLTFLGRLPVPVPPCDSLMSWAQAHPNGYVLAYSGRGRPPAELIQGVRLANGWIGLLPATRVDAHQNELSRWMEPEHE